MTDFTHLEALLPPNATAFEKALSRVSDLYGRGALLSDALPGFKLDAPDALLPWLIWEYGLGELLPYLREPRRVLEEGLLWQRLRGTPESLRIALGWVGLAEVALEQEPPGVHFAEFQFDPGRVLRDDALIADLVAVSRLAAPARSRLSRIVHGYDLRRCILSQCQTGDCLLSDYSGSVWAGDGVTRLSFGETHFGERALDQITARVTDAAREATLVGFARMIDRFILDYSRLGGQDAVRNPEFMHAHLFTFGNLDVSPDPFGVLPERRFCKAMVVLSDSTALGDINACTPRFAWIEQGEAMRFGGGDALSESTHRLLRQEILERFWRAHPAHTTWSLLAPIRAGLDRQRLAGASFLGEQQLGVLHLGEVRPVRHPAGSAAREHTLTIAAIADPNGFSPRLFQRAQLILSEAAWLGETDSRTPRAGLIRIAPIRRLGAMTLSDGPEVRWSPLTDMHERGQSAASAAPVDLALSAESAARTHTETLPNALSLTALGRLRLGEGHALANQPAFRLGLITGAAAWSGQTWAGMRWPAESWASLREIVSASHGTETEPAL
ncbi:phage tail protein [Lamprobacter modestohalophilus]|uniref:phage tail protein n=1 Tax=Lamprobacter modestohalophilus TaxID=1064514 RepID=UPI002ADEB432|nr:phage tail protein [Lamprobacter modestohalophilus]MEA1052363.1 phage tail protein [Lamprobacter modestohalophilus]